MTAIKACSQVEFLCNSSPVRPSAVKGKHERLSNVRLLLVFLQNSWVCFSDLQQKNWEGQPGLAPSTRRAIFMP